MPFIIANSASPSQGYDLTSCHQCSRTDKPRGTCERERTGFRTEVLKLSWTPRGLLDWARELLDCSLQIMDSAALTVGCLGPGELPPHCGHLHTFPRPSLCTWISTGESLSSPAPPSHLPPPRPPRGREEWFSSQRLSFLPLHAEAFSTSASLISLCAVALRASDSSLLFATLAWLYIGVKKPKALSEVGQAWPCAGRKLLLSRR